MTQETEHPSSACDARVARIAATEAARLNDNVCAPNTRLSKRNAKAVLRGIFKRPYCWVVLFFVCYVIGFVAVEHMGHDQSSMHILHSPLDDAIPFCEVFVIPYVLWFAYWVPTLIYFAARSILGAGKEDFFRLSWFLMIGMGLFIIVSAVYPNGLDLRPQELPRSNVFTWLCSLLWGADTSTNVLPSIHVYNTIGTHIAILRSRRFAGSRALKTSSWVISVLIILGTMFIKQHSVIDVAAALALAAVVFALVYTPLFKKVFRRTWAFCAADEQA